MRENEKFRHLREDAYSVLSVYSDSRELEFKKEEYRTKEGFDMCLALQEMMADSRIEGISEGKREGRIQGMEAVNELNRRLAEDGRIYDLFRSSQDFEFQKSLMREYAIECVSELW